ncbi:hypothetical protein NA57DRAFT_81310 [Rhizodiscina lignyota]|uniref:Uncharacterized protein n=1 Tax=Rhizodiscina lignyota TaxID=1504668 RepID=A0A9P4I574_9PEZI|nr:hypothetical protein NA57DRAFT_81310 [Rhizodiscina lignyota]
MASSSNSDQLYRGDKLQKLRGEDAEAEHLTPEEREGKFILSGDQLEQRVIVSIESMVFVDGDSGCHSQKKIGRSQGWKMLSLQWWSLKKKLYKVEIENSETAISDERLKEIRRMLLNSANVEEESQDGDREQEKEEEEEDGDEERGESQRP